MRYKLVIFDFDGTLADTFSWFAGLVDEIADRFRLDRIPSHEIEHLRNHSAREIVERLGVPNWKLPLIVRHVRRLAEQKGDHIRLFEGAERTLHTLAERGFTLAVVSSNAEVTVRRALGPGNADLMHHFACGASLFGKARLFRRVVRAASVAREHTICIGDELRDAEAARLEGLAFGAVAWGFTRVDALLKASPELVFRRIDEIAALLAPKRPQTFGAPGMEFDPAYA